MKRTSVNEMVRGFLTRLVEEEAEYDEATEALLKLARESQGRMGDWRPHARRNLQPASLVLIGWR